MKFSCGVIAIYHDINHEARSMDMLQCMEQLCSKCNYVSYTEPEYRHSSVYVPVKSGVFRYLHFIHIVKQTIRKKKPDLIFLHDNMCAPILEWLKKKKYTGCVIYDSSELYVLAKNQPDESKLKKNMAKALSFIVKKVKIKLAQKNIRIEANNLKYADVVIAANLERAEYMREHYGLKTLPCIFDNIHRIDDVVNVEECGRKFSAYLAEDRFYILYAGGIAKARRTYELVEAVQKASLKLPVTLIIVGRSDEEEKIKIDSFLQKNNCNCVHYLGYITRAELKYILQHSQASVAAFSKDTINNLYCASGKIYESLFEGVPLVTSTNPPLQRICREHHVGVSNDDFLSAIYDVYNNYEEYRRDVQKYIAEINFEARIPKLVSDLTELLPKGWKDCEK